MDEKMALRAVIRFFWKEGLSAQATAAKICAVEGEGTTNKMTVSRWFKKFNEGDTSLKDRPKLGRPSTVDPEIVAAAAEASSQTSTRRLSAELGVSKSTVHRKLQDLGMINRRCRVVPHELTPAQAQRRVEVCRELSKTTFDMRQIQRIVTSDEKWIFFRNPDTRNQWLRPGDLPEPVVKHGRFEHKVMLCVWWNFEGVVHYELVPDGHAINAELYNQQLDRMYAVLARKYPALVNRRRVLLQQDNAPAHNSRMAQQKIGELDGCELLPHPAYSPDLAPSDYHLFRAMAHFLRGRTFDNLKEVDAGVQEFFASKSPEWYRAGIQNLAERWLKVIEHNGLYFEN